MANFFEQFHPEETSPRENFFARFHKDEAPIPGQITLPLVGTPSLIGMAKAALHAAGLPGEVYQGTVDPLSDEGIQRSLELAAVASPLSVARGTGIAISRANNPSPLVGIKNAPTSEALRSAAEAGYQTARESGVELAPEGVSNFGSTVRAQLNEKGIDENLAPKTFGILGRLDNVPKGAPTVTISNMESLRRTLGNAAASPDKTERLAATTARRALDDYLADLPAGDVLAGDAGAAASALTGARGNYAALARDEAFQRAVEKAENRAGRTGSGGNLQNALRQEVSKVGERQGGLSSAERGLISGIDKGTLATNTLRLAGKLSPTSGFFPLVGHLAAAPLTGGSSLPVAAAGYLAQKAAEKLTRRQIENLRAAIRARSPLGQQARVPAPVAPVPRLNPLMTQPLLPYVLSQQPINAR
jgi:hypothetical protein